MHKIAKYLCRGKILEVGCGEFPLFEDSIKIDINPIKGKNYICADLNKPLGIKKKFDTIIGLDIIEHLYDVHIFLEECKRLCNTEGKLILSTPNVLSWKNRIFLLFGKDYTFRNGYESTRHLVFFSPKWLNNY